ncbi:MAG: hypothetical protein RLZZ32_1493 [Cyanobacteriota bacterium]|jgi:hypothetical protein
MAPVASPYATFRAADWIWPAAPAQVPSCPTPVTAAPAPRDKVGCKSLDRLPPSVSTPTKKVGRKTRWSSSIQGDLFQASLLCSNPGTTCIEIRQLSFGGLC